MRQARGMDHELRMQTNKQEAIKTEQKEPEFKDDLDYLLKSLEVIEREKAKLLESVKRGKTDLASLEEDMRVIKTPGLQNACKQLYNKLSQAKSVALDKIKALNTDFKHVNSILKKVKLTERIGSKKNI